MKGTALSWVIGLWLFLTFLLIVVNLFSYKINLYLQENKPSKIEIKNPKYIYEVDVEFDPNYVFFCDKDNLKEFCEHFPIFIPVNFPFLPNYGTFNNTVGEYFKIKNFSGIFFIVNISDSIPKTSYMLVKVCNNENRNLTDVQIRIPVYYLKYQGIYQLSVKDANTSKNYYFCYEYENLECLPDGSSNIGGYRWNYHIWVKLNISANNCIYLNISKGNNAYATDGSKIFDYYFTKFKIINNNEVWDNEKEYNILNATYALYERGIDVVQIGHIVIFNPSLFSNKIADIYMEADDNFYVNGSFEYPSSSDYSWYKFYDLKNWASNYATFSIDTIRIRKKANITVEIVYPKIIKKCYLILGEKPNKVSGVYSGTNYITNNYLKVYFSNGKLEEEYITFIYLTTTLWYIDNVDPSKLIFNRSYTFAYANYSNIFIILPPNSTFTIAYNLTVEVYAGDIDRWVYNYTPYNFYVWQSFTSTERGIICDINCDDIFLWYMLDNNRIFYYIFYGENFDKFTVERIIDFFKFPKIKVKFVKME